MRRLLCLFLLLSAALPAAPTVVTFAGDGSAAYAGDGGDAREASLNRPMGLAKDSAGNVYIADCDNHVVRKVDALSGVISTVAGDGNPGFSGDGGPAVAAELDGPTGLWVDASDQLYIADHGNNAVRVVDGSGQISSLPVSFAGDPLRLLGDNAGNLYVAGYDHLSVEKFTSPSQLTLVVGCPAVGPWTCGGFPYMVSSPGQPALGRWPRHPSGLFFLPGGELAFAQGGAGNLFRVDSGGVLQSLTVSSALWGPMGLAADPSGGFWAADTGHQRVCQFDAGGNLLFGAGSGVEGYADGPAAGAQFRSPVDVLPLGGGRVLIADARNHRVRLLLDSADAALTPAPAPPAPTPAPSDCGVVWFDGVLASRDDAWSLPTWSGVGETGYGQGSLNRVHLDVGGSVQFTLGPGGVDLSRCSALEFDFSESSYFPYNLPDVQLNGLSIRPYLNADHVAIPLSDFGATTLTASLTLSVPGSYSASGSYSLMVSNARFACSCAGQPTYTPIPHPLGSTTRTQTPSATPTPSPTQTPTPGGTPPSATASPSATPTWTPSPSFSASPSHTLSPTPSYTDTATPFLSATPSASPTATPVLSPSPSLTAGTPPATAVPANSALSILALALVPNPNPANLVLRLSAPADRVTVRVWTVTLRLAAQVELGPLPAGWNQQPLPPSLLAGLPNGLYLLSVSASQGASTAPSRAPVRFLLLH